MKRFLAIFTFLFIWVNSSFSRQSSLNWLTNYTTAIAAAAKENKAVLLFFHGSDWCPPCIKMQRDVFSDSNFIDFAATKLIFLDVDFPSKPPLTAAQLKHNQAVKKQFGLPDDFTQGYPQIIIIDASGKILYQEKGYDEEGAGKLIGIVNTIIENLH
jgi:thioredoxin-related protein